ncbi:MAG: hypothetical protein R3B40_23625 [Polyangiales bacterium]
MLDERHTLVVRPHGRVWWLASVTRPSRPLAIAAALALTLTQGPRARAHGPHLPVSGTALVVSIDGGAFLSVDQHGGMGGAHLGALQLFCAETHCDRPPFFGGGAYFLIRDLGGPAAEGGLFLRAGAKTVYVETAIGFVERGRTPTWRLHAGVGFPNALALTLGIALLNRQPVFEAGLSVGWAVQVRRGQ